MVWGVDHDEPFQVRALPELSTATQNEAVAHDTDVRPSPIGSMDWGVDQNGRTAACRGLAIVEPPGPLAFKEKA
jgi:hypothetical protein